MTLARRRRGGPGSSFEFQSRMMKTPQGKTYYRRTRKAGVGAAKAKRAAKRTSVRRRNTSMIAKLFKMVIAKSSKRRRR